MKEMVNCYYLFIVFRFLLGYLHVGDGADRKILGLSVSPGLIKANIGDQPSLVCSVNGTAQFLLANPLRWVFVSRNTVELVISTRAIVEHQLTDKFNVEFDGNDGKLTFTLKFLKGISQKDDGYFKCAVYKTNPETEILSQTVEVKVSDFGYTATTVKNQSQYVTMTRKNSSTNLVQSLLLATSVLCVHILSFNTIF